MLPFTHREIVDNPVSAYDPVIISDPTRQDDQEFINRLIAPAYPNLMRAEFPYGSHSLLQAFKDQGTLSAFTRPIIEMGAVPPVQLNREGSATWHTERGRVLLEQGEIASAEEHLRTALDIQPSKKAAARSLVGLLGRADRHEEVDALQETLVEQTSRKWLPFPAGWRRGRFSMPALSEAFQPNLAGCEGPTRAA